MRQNGWIIYNGNLRSQDFNDFAKWLYTAGKKRNIHMKIYKNTELLALMTGNDINLLQINSITLPDFVLFIDKDIYLARQLELLNIPVFNSSKAIEISDDKIATYQVLAQKGIQIPKTIVAPKIFANHHELDLSFTQKIVDILGFPMIIKEAFGSFGEQVYLIHSYEEMLHKVKKLAGKPFVFQAFIDSSFGRDIRLQVVGDRVVASMLRKSADDFRANITAGGTMEIYDPSEAECKLAIDATKAIGADFAGVDLLFGPDQTPIVCEVNSNAHIHNLFNCTHINAADFIVDHVITILEHRRGAFHEKARLDYLQETRCLRKPKLY